jgi:prepilin-type N-terminal cleavage/methylation domain-containing protein
MDMHRDQPDVGPVRTGRGSTLQRINHACAGVSLIELLCVCIIIAILASLLLPALARSYRRAKAMQEEFDAPVVFEQILHRTWAYCGAQKKYRFDTRDDLADKCDLPSKSREWLRASQTEFVPFTFIDATNTVVLTFHYGHKYRSTREFTKGELSIRPQD